MLEQRLVGAQEPRILVVPEGEDHPLWQEVVEFVEALGVLLDPWQMLALRIALRRAGEFWAAFAVAICAPRQNGKNGILEIRELIGPLVLGEKLLIHTAHLADTSKEAFRRLDDLIDANGWLSQQVRHIWRTNGHESIEFVDGRRIRFRTRTRGGGRGFSGSPVFFDEAMFLPEISMGAIMPVISAQPDPQLWYLGSAVDQTLMEDGVAFARVRERALRGDHKRLAYLEWSLDAETPDAVEPEVAADPESWASTNPALGVRISQDYVEAEQREMDARTFAVERLGVGDWPATDGSGRAVIDIEAWRGLIDSESEIVGPVSFAFDVKPDRSASTISASGLRADGLAHVEVIEHRAGTGWLVERLVALDEAHDPVSVSCDGVGPASSLVHALREKGVEVEEWNGREHANACALIFDLVGQDRLRHLGSVELNAAVKGAAKRDLGDAWAWSRRSSGVDISPLVACTLALWGAVTTAKKSEPVFAWA